MSFEFFKSWLCRPLSVGAIAPSGRALASAMVTEMGRAPFPGPVVELGGGTGSITQAILQTGVEPHDLIVIEREANLCRLLEDRYPDVGVIRASAEDLDSVLASRGTAQAGAIVSSLPLLCFGESACRRIVGAAFDSLADGQPYLQFTYGPKAPIPQSVRDDLGIQGKRLKWVVQNLPPAAVWCFRRDNGGRHPASA